MYSDIRRCLCFWCSSRVESEEEKTDSEDDEYMDDMELQATTMAKKVVRRESVSAEQVGANTVSIRCSTGHTMQKEDIRKYGHRWT